MKSLARRAAAGLLTLAAIDAGAQGATQAGGVVAPDEPQGTGPRGSSQPARGEQRFDVVGPAGVGEMSGIAVVAPNLPSGSFVEVTALDSGRTIVAVGRSGEPAADRVAILSTGAATALGLKNDGDGVRVRRMVPTPPEIAALRSGAGAPTRDAAPPALLVALRRKMPAAAVPGASATVRRDQRREPVAGGAATPPGVTARAPARITTASAASRLVRGSYVQLAALSSASRAQALAREVGGVVEPHGALYRVHLGPFTDAAGLARGRARAAALGYSTTQIVRITP